MSPESPGSIDQVIQLAVAPVFLLTGIGAFIGVFAGRLGRIVDRRRSLEEAPKTSCWLWLIVRNTSIWPLCRCILPRT